MISDIDIFESSALDLSKSFTLFFNGNVLYDGRASSALCDGNYLLLKKSDGCIQIHGATKTNPLNYMASGTTLRFDANKIICKRKSEVVEITINEIINLMYFDLSDNSIQLIKSEAHLVDKLCNNISTYLNINSEYTITREYKTKYGPIDVLVQAGGITYVIEAKRKKITISACIQVRKYGEEFEQPILYVAGPAIGKPASEYAKKHGIGYININFD